MSRIFISHSSRNNPQAAALRDWLVAHGWEDVFLDFDPERGLTPGQRWMEALRTAAERCEAVICLISEAWLASQWCEDEARMAWYMGKLIIGVLIDDMPFSRIPGWMTTEWQHVNLAAPGERTAILTRIPPDNAPYTVNFHAENLERLRLGLQRAGLSANTFAWPPEHDPNRAPYRGLLPLEAEDAGIFFGRDAQIVRGLDQFRNLRQEGSGCLIVILGASGAGKSSFLRAGLLPRLARADRHFLPLPVVRPEMAVLTGETGLVAALEKACAGRSLSVSRAELRREVNEGAGAVSERLAALQAAAPILTLEGEARPEPPTIVLPVDQGEELFTATDAGESGRFLHLLADLLNGPSHIIAVIAIRSESYPRLQEAPEVGDVWQVPFNLPPVRRGAYQEIIEGPAEALPSSRKLEIAPELTERLLSDLERGGGADPLPLLAFTLERLYTDYRRSGRLELVHYEAMGGLSGSISASVDAAIRRAQEKGSAPAERTEALQLLRRAFIPGLCRIDPETRAPLRRVARRDEIPFEARGLVDELINRRLLVSGLRTHAAGAEPIIDIAHESLLRQWPLLRDWLVEETGALLLLDGVQRAAADWAEAKERDTSLLLHRGGRLEDALAISRRADLAEALGHQGREYLSACETNERRRKAARRRRKQWTGMGATAVIVAFLVGGGAFLYGTDVFRTVSLLHAEKASEANENGNYAKGLLWALGGLPKGNAAWVLKGPDARAQLLRAYHNRDHMFLKRLAGHDDAINQAVFSPDGALVLTASLDGTARLWDARTGGELEMLEGHENPVVYAAFSRDGRHVVTVSEDATARLWDAKTGEALKTLEGHGEAVNHAAFSPDGARVVTASVDGTARLWDARTGEDLQTLEGHQNSVAHAAFSPDGTQVVTASEDGTARIWDARTGAELNSLGDRRGDVIFAAISLDGSRVITAFLDGTARLWSTAADVPPKPLKGHEGPINRAAFSRDGRHVVTASKDGTARLWDARTGEHRGTLEGHQDTVRHAAFSPDSTLVATASEDGTARLWDAETGAHLKTFAGHGGYVVHAAFSPGGAHVVTTSGDGTAAIWDARSGIPAEPVNYDDGIIYATISSDGARVVTISDDGMAAQIHDARTGDLLMLLRGHERSIRHAALSPGGSRVVTTSEDGTARLWDAKTGSPPKPLEGHEGAVLHAAFSPDGALVVTASKDGTARLWDAGTGEHRRTFAGHQDLVRHTTFSPDGTLVITASEDGMARLWDIRRGDHPKHLLRHEERVELAAISPDGARVVTVCGDGTARLWNVAKGAQMTALEDLQGEESEDPRGEDQERVFYAAFSHDGSYVVTTHDDGAARLWDARDGSLRTKLEGHTDQVTHAAFSPDGARLVTISDDNTARLWDAKAGVFLTALDHEAWVTHAAFSPDGKRLLTVSGEGTSRLWELPERYREIAAKKTASLVRTACELAGKIGMPRFSESEMQDPILEGRSPDPCKPSGPLSVSWWKDRFLPE